MLRDVEHREVVVQKGERETREGEQWRREEQRHGLGALERGGDAVPLPPGEAVPIAPPSASVSASLSSSPSRPSARELRMEMV